MGSMRISACRVSVRMPFSTSWLVILGFSKRAAARTSSRRASPLDAMSLWMQRWTVVALGAAPFGFAVRCCPAPPSAFAEPSVHDRRVRVVRADLAGLPADRADPRRHLQGSVTYSTRNEAAPNRAMSAIVKMLWGGRRGYGTFDAVQ
jgi:hypothetical protein